MNENRNISIGVSMSMGAVSYAHDIRKSIKHNVNTDLIQDNVVLVDEIANFQRQWIKENQERTAEEKRPTPKNDGEWMRAYLDHKMKPYMDEWQAKRRKDKRTNETYTEWHENQRKHSDNKKGDLFYEFVFQYGSGEDIGRRYYEVAEQLLADPHNQELQQRKKELQAEFIGFYNKCLEDLQKKYGLTVIFATIHFDEGFREINGKRVCGTPHLHACVSAITDPTQEKQRFVKGPSVQISMNKVMESHGIERIKSHSKEKLTAEQKQGYQLSRMCIEYRKEMEKAVLAMGYGKIKEPQEKRPHMAPDMYYAAETERQRAEAEHQRAEAEMNKRQELQAQVKELTETIQKKNQDLEETMEYIKALDAFIIDRNYEIHQKDGEIAALKRDMANCKREIASYQNEIADYQHQINNYDMKLAEINAVIEEAEAERQEAEMQRQEAEIQRDTAIVEANQEEARKEQNTIEADKQEARAIRNAKIAEIYSQKGYKEDKKLGTTTMRTDRAQTLTSCEAKVKELVNSPIFHPKEIDEMQRATDEARRKKREYERMIQDNDKIIDERVADKLALQDHTQSNQIERLEMQLAQKTADMNWLLEQIKKFLEEHVPQLIPLFERITHIQITERTQDQEEEITHKFNS